MPRLRHCHAGAALSVLLTREAAAAADAADPLAPYALQFHHPTDATGRKLVYLCGHSLGLQPVGAARYVEEELSDWRHLGVLGHHVAKRPWIEYHQGASAALAEICGATALEVVAMNSLTVNLHLMMVSFFRPDAIRNRVLIEHSAFPSDRYAILSQLAFHGLTPEHLIEVTPRPGERVLRSADVIECIEEAADSLALVLLPGVQYLSGQAFDLGALTQAARRAGAAVGLDLAHAIGNTPLRLHDWECDFAVWCSYKYLNSGPGAVGGCFVHERHAHTASLPRFAGWWGHNARSRFQFEPDFEAMEGAQGWQISNPPILSTAPLLASLEIFKRVGMAALGKKSHALTGFLQELIEAQCAGLVEIITPAGDARGCQLSLRILRPAAQAKDCQAKLTAAGVIGDWREPDILRLAPVPLYNSFSDVHDAAAALAQALRD